MSTSLPDATQVERSDGTIQLAVVKERHFKAPIVLAVLTVLLGAIVLFVPRDGASTFRLGDPSQSFALPNVALPTAVTCWVLLAVLALLTVWAFWLAWSYRRQPLWLTIAFGILGVFAFLVWAAADGLVPVSSLLFGAVSLSVPLVFGRSAASSASGSASSTSPSRASCCSALSRRRCCRASPATRSSASSAPWSAVCSSPLCWPPSPSSTSSTRSSSVSC